MADDLGDTLPQPPADGRDLTSDAPGSAASSMVSGEADTHSLSATVADDVPMQTRAPTSVRASRARPPARQFGTRATPATPARKRRVPRWAVIGTIVMVLFVVIGGGAVSALQIYHSLRHAKTDATDAVHHLNTVRALIPPSLYSRQLDGLAPLLTPTKLATITRELRAADADFKALTVDLASTGAMGIAAHTPMAGDALTTAQLLADAGDQGCQAGLLLIGDTTPLLAYLNGGIFTDGTNKNAGLSAETLTKLRQDVATATAMIDRAMADISRANLNAIPSALLKPSDVLLLHDVVGRWPKYREAAVQAQSWLAALPTVLGVKTPASYLVEVMDSTELRPGGGFIGNYSILTLTGGQAEPFTLVDTGLLDGPYLYNVGYRSPSPSQYPWWPFSDIFGLRDSNLSPDFPTNAQLGMKMLSAEGGQKVQGVIAVTPMTVKRILQVVGPIPMPLYNTTVTSDNLVPLIEHYQLGAKPLNNVPAADQISSPSKRFTALLGRALLDKLHSLSLAQTLSIAQSFLTDVHQKDLQLYLTDSASEALLAKIGYASTVPHTPGDAVTINDANDNVNKGSLFTAETYKDSVRLDAQGNATHDLTITYNFHVTDFSQLYGPDSYRTYLRIYTPPEAQLSTMSGLRNLRGFDQLGHSDLSWRQMWGGYVLVTDGVPYTLHMTWVVPHAATRDSSGHWHYSIDYQRQPGGRQVLNLSVTVPGHTKPVTFSGGLEVDEVMNLNY